MMFKYIEECNIFDAIECVLHIDALKTYWKMIFECVADYNRLDGDISFYLFVVVHVVWVLGRIGVPHRGILLPGINQSLVAFVLVECCRIVLL